MWQPSSTNLGLQPVIVIAQMGIDCGSCKTQVAAYTSGQLQVCAFDCLLLQHVLWQRPDEGPRIADWVMTQLAEDDGMQQAEYLMTGGCL